MSDKKTDNIQTNTIYKYIMWSVISIALIIFIISTTLLLSRVIPDAIALSAGVYNTVTERLETTRERERNNAERDDTSLAPQEERRTSGSSQNSTKADFDIELRTLGEVMGPHKKIYENSFLEIDTNDTLGFIFRVTNIGDTPTQPWEYEMFVREPFFSNDDLDYISETAPSLAPGAYVDIPVYFSDLDEGRYRFIVDVDPNNKTDEETNRNNELKISIEVVE